MASAIVKDIDEKFCQCSICLDQYKEPKLLPCLHRFCKDCLAEVIKQNLGNLSCPVCREECVVPEEGLESFKTDFYMKNIIEYVQLQTSLEDNHMQECYGCSKTLKVSAYCFKCNDFLCEACHQFHVTSKITKDHRPHILAVEDVTSKRLSLDKLASLKEAPRCFTHSEKLSELCCKTCSSTPICIACTYGIHKGHDFYEVTALANEERQKLEQELAGVCSLEEEILQMPEKLDKIKHDINTVVSEQIRRTESEYLNVERNTTEKVQSLENESKVSRNEKEIALNKELKVVEWEMEKEIQQIKEKYDKICDEKRRKFKDELEISQRQHNEEVSKLRERVVTFDNDCKEATASLEKQRQDNLSILKEISEHYENTNKRFKNLKATASAMLKTKYDWTAVQCIPDIFAACNPLVVAMRKQFPDLETLVQIKTKHLPFFYFDSLVNISDQESVVNVEGITAKGWNICEIRTSQNGKIVITGNAAMGKSHITVIEETGKVVNQWVLSNISKAWEEPDRFFDFLHENTIVTVCDPNEISIFDISDGVFKKKRNISSLTRNWPTERGVTCIVTDPVNKQIIVGSWEDPLLCVFNEHLSLLRTLTIPVPNTGAMGILLDKQNLIICCFDPGSAFIMTIFGSQGESGFQLPKPDDDDDDDDGSDWKALNGCKDENGCIYILWTYGFYSIGQGKHVIAKYGPDGSHVLAMQEADDNAISITTTKFNNRQVLLVTTCTSGKLYQYDLIPHS